MKGTGLLNNIINNLPVELHIPGYQFCGPGTKIRKRLLRGDRGINKLDEACMYHDIAYSNTDLNSRHKADLELMNMASKRLKSKDAGKGEKMASWLVKNAMKAKLKTGAGVNSFKNGVSKIRAHLMKHKCKNNKAAIKFAYTAAKKIFNKKKGIRVPRLIPIPTKTGGFLPLIPIFAGLSALGSLAGGAAGIAKAVNDYKSAQQNLKESERHNKTMESIAIGKGFYVKPYKKGSGLCLNNTKN